MVIIDQRTFLILAKKGKSYSIPIFITIGESTFFMEVANLLDLLSVQ